MADSSNPRLGRHLKLILFVVAAFLFFPRVCLASFVFNMESLDRPAISQLSDEKLLGTYTDLLIELEASTTFSTRAGFSENDYKKYKKLLRFRVDMYQEIIKRKLKIPRIQ